MWTYFDLISKIFNSLHQSIVCRRQLNFKITHSFWVHVMLSIQTLSNSQQTIIELCMFTTIIVCL